jgi:hypothetical protein
MLDLAPHIKQLLFDHNCVIVPRFGGFVANPHGAKLNALKARFEPPFKEIGFNPQLTKNDGLLANHIQNETQVNYDAVLKQIEESVEEIKKVINQGKTFRMPSIGSFYKDSQNNLRFSASNDENFDLNFFGFEAISASKILRSDSKEKGLKQETATVPVVPIFSEKQERSEGVNEVLHSEEGTNLKQRQSSNWKNIAVAAACIPLLFYLTWLPTRMDVDSNQVKFQWSNLNPYTAEPCPLYEKRLELPLPIVEHKQNNTLADKLIKAKKSFVRTSFFEHTDVLYNSEEQVTIALLPFAAQPVSTKVVHPFVHPTQLKPYYIVGGCFKDYNNANNYVNTLRKKGFNAELVDRKGELYRVSLEAAVSEEEMLLKLDLVKAQGFKDAWVLRK